MTISESDFHNIADAFLEGLFEALEEAIGDQADVDLNEGILNIELDSGGEYIINKHAPNKQVWLSSPKSGASTYDYEADGSIWMGSRGQGNLVELLSSELGKEIEA